MNHAPHYSVTLHLGASAFSLLVLEHHSDEDLQLEYLEQPVPIARDIFRQGKVKRSTIEQCVDILQSFQDAIGDFGLTKDDIKVSVATNIIKEASNYTIFLNRLEIASGVKFTALDNGAMTQLILKKVRDHHQEVEFSEEGKTLAIHVGPGNTRALLLNDGMVERFTTYRLGSHRTAEALHNSQLSGEEYLRVIRAHCEPHINAIKYDYRRENIKYMILIGTEIQTSVALINPDRSYSSDRTAFADFLAESSLMNEEERLSEYHLDYHSEDGFLPALQINATLLNLFDIQQHWIPTSEYDRGLLMDLSYTHKNNLSLDEEILHAARLLAKKYAADPNHYEHVLSQVETLFHQTQEIHNLSTKQFNLLKVATIVHEIGGYISPRIHHKHSYHLIKHSEIFGLDERNRQIIALVARYHRQSPPKNTHKEYIALSREDQLTVSKLSALLRVADSLDACQQQNIFLKNVVHDKNGLILEVTGSPNINLESLALSNKGNLFEQLFGLTLQLQHISNLSL